MKLGQIIGKSCLIMKLRSIFAHRGPVVFGQDGPLNEMAMVKFQVKIK